MKTYIWHTPTGWYWRGAGVNCCGPFETAAQATADAMGLRVEVEA
jgi:hypothetical protein